MSRRHYGICAAGLGLVFALVAVLAGAPLGTLFSAPLIGAAIPLEILALALVARRPRPR